MKRATKPKQKQEPSRVIKLARRMTVLFRDRLEERLQPLGLSAAQFQLLAALVHQPRSSGAQVARWCQVTPQSTHALMAAAEKLGWLARTPHAENEHTLLAELTPEGEALFQRARLIALRLQNQMLSGFSEREVQQMERLLSLAIASLEQIP